MEHLYIVAEFVREYMAEFILFLYIGFLILFISLLVSNHKNRKLLEKYNGLVRNFNGENFEELILYLQNHVNDLNAKVNTLKLETKTLEERLDFAVQSVGFIRYNAFDDMGSEMSYSIAFLDSFKNGFVLTGIYGRDQTVTYAKDIKNGESTRTLSAEEMIAVDRALKGQTTTQTTKA
ncbi:DUF4446 family protein [Tissierella creatinophila]|uniref:DUF4446 domain-containing protein n=1 Tax=Tissierella creatinophila DSM 6911 TaxID=1123403 RepID=A0A1U7M2N0_TISCR|nr:DUF4446 family protein [Tissierella creatinophila]OLS01448.1 hypothetical protein TICRE_24870 [Tissierella creatinophila DSM 6911]